MADYSQLTDQEFDDLLCEYVNEAPASNLLDVPGVYELVKEHYNNEILDRWAERNPEKAYPEEEE